MTKAVERRKVFEKKIHLKASGQQKENLADGGNAKWIAGEGPRK